MRMVSDSCCPARFIGGQIQKVCPPSLMYISRYSVCPSFLSTNITNGALNLTELSVMDSISYIVPRKLCIKFQSVPQHAQPLDAAPDSSDREIITWIGYLVVFPPHAKIQVLACPAFWPVFQRWRTWN